MERARSSALPVAAACLVLILAGCLAYFNSLATPLQFDDLDYVAEDRIELVNRPIITLSFRVNRALGDSLLGVHLWNLAVHLLAGLTLFGLVRRTLLLPRWRGAWDRSATAVALAIALLWLVHPLLTSAVTYVIQRCESMMGLCFLFCHYALARGSQSPRGMAWYAAGVLVGIVGSGCKEVMVVAPVTLLLYDRTFLADSWRDVFRSRGWVHLAFAACAVFPIWISLPQFRSTQEAAAVGFSVSAVTPWQYLLTQPSVLLHYLRLSVWPRELSFSYRDWPIAQNLADSLPFAIPVVALLGATAVGVWKGRWWGFLGAWFFVILAPTSSFIPIADVCLEYRMYLPLAAVVTLVVVCVWQLLLKALQPPLTQLMGLTLTAAAALVLTTLTYERNLAYRSSVTLWEDTVHKRPHDLMAYLNLGYSYLRVGDADKAETVFQQSFTLPGNPRVFLNCYNLGALLANRGDVERGLPLIREAHRIDPNDPLALNFLGVIDYLEDRPLEAVRWLELVLQKHPRNVPAHFLLAAVLDDGFPNDPAKQTRARALLAKGKELDPDMPQRLRAAALQEVASSKPFVHKKALFDAKVANHAAGGRDPEILFALGQAFERLSDKERAKSAYEAALAVTSPRSDSLAARIRGRLLALEPRP